MARTARGNSPLPRSLANVKSGFAEQKWADANSWVRKKLARTGNRKYRPCDKQKPDAMVAEATSASPHGSTSSRRDTI